MIEYKEVKFTSALVSPADIANEESKDGWELVCVDSTHAYFKRGVGVTISNDGIHISGAITAKHVLK